MNLLEVEGLAAGYGQSQVLFDIGLAVAPGQCVTLLGRNGMGKTTTIKTIMGLLRPWGGVVRWKGRTVQGRPPHAMARLGLGLVPEGRQVFPNLTVRENLVATGRGGGSSHAWTLARVHALFPRLAERASNFGNQLSGGEQQMLAIGRALMTNPELLILDEARKGCRPWCGVRSGLRCDRSRPKAWRFWWSTRTWRRCWNWLSATTSSRRARWPGAAAPRNCATSGP